MFPILLCLLIVLVGTSGCCLLSIHLVGKKAEQFKWIAWVALGLSCAAVIADVTVSLVFNYTRLNECAEPYLRTRVDDNDTSDIPLVVVPRSYWTAEPRKAMVPLRHPVEYVVISHTAMDSCTAETECILAVKFLRSLHLKLKKRMDIPYNFLVAGDGRAYEGRGWDVEGAHTAANFNDISIGISFLGYFSEELPPYSQISACKRLIEKGVQLGKISADYKLIADRQVSQNSNAGKKLFEELKLWRHWSSEL